MVVCKYFLRGTCRFGEGCKNEHSYTTENSASIMRKKQDLEPSMLVKSVSNDMDKAEKGNQWPLSCYGPFQGKPCLPGFEDKCFEEIRLGMYEAERNGTVEQYKQQLTLLLQEARLKMHLLQNPTPEVTNVLKELYNTADDASVFSRPQATGVFGNNTAAGASIFGNTAASPQNPFVPAAGAFAVPETANPFSSANTGSIFSQPPVAKPTFQSGSIFSNVAPNQSIFANAAPQPAAFPTVFPNQNMFAQPTQPTGNSPFAAAPSNSPFASPPASNSPFAVPQPAATNSPFTANPATTTGGSPFGPVAANQSPFATGAFSGGQAAPPDHTGSSVFAQPAATSGPEQPFFVQGQRAAVEHSASIFGGTAPPAPASVRMHEPSVYSTELSAGDRRRYEAPAFEFGQIPELAPSAQLCS